ncbi:MAG: hypothetical protein IJ083_02945 [Clostridia bacterium]|nr:hypothetical protein [Clostridia bacterium]
MDELDRMSFRRFMVLLKNLSPMGALARAMEEERRSQADRQVDDRAAANDFFASLVR